MRDCERRVSNCEVEKVKTAAAGSALGAAAAALLKALDGGATGGFWGGLIDVIFIAGGAVAGWGAAEKSAHCNKGRDLNRAR